MIPINAKSTEYHSLSYDSTEVYSSEFVRDNAELITDPLVKYKVSRDSDDTYYTIRISKNGLFKEHKSVMFEIDWQTRQMILVQWNTRHRKKL